MFWFSKLVHLWPIYVLLLAYTPNLLIIDCLEASKSVLSKFDQTYPPPLSDMSDETYLEPLSLKSLDMFRPWPGHICPTGHTYPALGLTGIKGGFIPLWTLGLLFHLHSNPLWLQVLSRRFGDSSTKSLRFLEDSSPLPLVFMKP
jgi:hypothetical protein